MAGTLFGLPLSQQFDTNGDPLSGALLYLFAAGTSTPVISYAESGLTTAQSNPLVADSSGRIPQFWLNDGSYRARLTTALGVEVFDEDGILAIGPSTAGGGSGSSVDATAVFATGDMKWRPVTGALTGWVRANARTIGSASSGGTERASADTQTLFEFLWNNFSDTLCPVTLGRGASAISDFNANKVIATLDMRGRSTFGLDDMGNSAASILVTGTPTAAASATGLEKTSITVATANLPVQNLSLASLTGSVGTPITNGTNVTHTLNNADFGTFSAAAGPTNVFDSVSSQESNLTLASGAVTFGGTLPLGGSGTALTPTTISPGRLGTFYIKL